MSIIKTFTGHRDRKNPLIILEQSATISRLVHFLEAVEIVLHTIVSQPMPLHKNPASKRMGNIKYQKSPHSHNWSSTRQIKRLHIA